MLHNKNIFTIEIKEKSRYEYIISAMKKFIELCYKDRADLNKKRKY